MRGTPRRISDGRKHFAEGPPELTTPAPVLPPDSLSYLFERCGGTVVPAQFASLGRFLSVASVLDSSGRLSVWLMLFSARALQLIPEDMVVPVPSNMEAIRTLVHQLGPGVVLVENE